MEIVDATNLKLDVENISASPLRRTGALAGDISEAISQRHAQDPIALRESSMIRSVLTDQNRKGFFAGSQGALLREIIHPLPTDKFAASDILCELLDDSDPAASRQRIEQTLRTPAAGGRKVKVIFETADAELLRDGETWAQQFGSGPVVFVNKAGSADVREIAKQCPAPRGGFVTQDEWQRARVRLVVPRAFERIEIASSMSRASTMPNGFTCTWLSTNTMNPLG